MALIQGLVEALMGRRPLHQLRPRLGARAFKTLSDRVDSGRYRRLHPGRIRSQMPTPACVEASVSLAMGGRSLTCTIRLDLSQGGWRCSEFVVLEPAALAAA